MGIKKQTKTMRINRRDFFMLTIMTPLFAAVVATVLVLGIVMPALKNDKLEVPNLGDTKDSTTKSVTYHIEEYDEDATKKEETKTEEKPAETQKTEAPVAAKLPTLIKTQPSSQKTAQTQQKQNTNTNAQNDAKKKAEEDAKKKAEAEATQANKEAAAKAACEARTDGPRTYIRVHFLTSIDRFYATLFSDKEDPIVDYYKASAKEGKSTKMFYQNGACLPSVEDFDIIEDSYLEEADLEAYGITARTDYEAWI